jgi:hypothetical protein
MRKATRTVVGWVTDWVGWGAAKSFELIRGSPGKVAVGEREREGRHRHMWAKEMRAGVSCCDCG